MKDYKKLYSELLEAGELPEQFTGNWEEDEKEFILIHQKLEEIVMKQTNDLFEDDDEDLYEEE